jgi:hypothetical protein
MSTGSRRNACPGRERPCSRKVTVLPARRAEVEDFIDVLKARKGAAAKRLGEVFEKLDALNLPDERGSPGAEIDAARAERRTAVRIVAEINTALSERL